MGQVIKSNRLKLGLSQQELGDKVGVNKAAVQKWENGSVENIRRSVIRQLSLIFDICPTELLGWSEQWSDCIDTKNNTNSSLSPDEKQLISDYRDLSEQGQEYIRQTIFIAKQTYKKSSDTSILEKSSGA